MRIEKLYIDLKEVVFAKGTVQTTPGKPSSVKVDLLFKSGAGKILIMEKESFQTLLRKLENR